MLTFDGLAGPVAALAFSADGATLAVGGMAGGVHLFRPPVDAGELANHAGGVNALALSPDGRFLASGGVDGKVQVWDVRDRQRVVVASSPLQSSFGGKPSGLPPRASRQDRGPAATDHLQPTTSPQLSPISAITFVGPGTVLFGLGERGKSVAQSATLFLLDLPHGKPRPTSFEVVNGIRALAGLPDRRAAAWATDKKVLRVQEITRPRQPEVPLKHDCRALTFSPDGRRLAVSSDWEVLIFDITRWPERATTLGRHQGVVSALAFGSDGRTLYSGDWKNTVRVWDVERQTERATYTWPVGNRVTALAVSPDGLRAAVGGDSGTVAVWDLD
jgi:WD40 repeat protein